MNAEGVAEAGAKVAKGRHFEFIDGLRGVAAASVVLFHIYGGTLKKPLAQVIPPPIGFLLEHGDLGVQVFFVISGFVIAHSLRHATITGRYIFNFALRRQVRLDPPYWSTLLLATANLWLPWLLHPERAKAPPPSGGQLLAHIFYLQDILGKGDVVVVFWTLCIEVQFYLFFIVLLAVAQRLGGSAIASDGVPGERAFLMVFAAPAAASLSYMALIQSRGPWFLPYWYMFTLGAGMAFVIEGRLRLRFIVGLGAMAVLVGVSRRAPEPFIATLVAGGIYAASRSDGLHRWLRQRPFQYLGAISYSLYLVHYDVGFRFLNAGAKLTGESPYWALIWATLGIAASLVAAQLLHMMIERPSIRLAARLRHVTPSVPPSAA